MTNGAMNFNPNWVSPPGETILDLLEERGWSQSEFAERVGYTKKHVNKLVKGTASISDDAAIRFEKVLGSTARFWLAREIQYREALARQQEIVELRRQQAWLKELPIAHMVRYNWIRSFTDKGQQVAECLRYFEVASVRAWRKRYERPLAAYKASESHKMKPGPVAAWLKQCERQAADVGCQAFTAKKFRKTLLGIRALTTEHQVEVFAPKLEELCAAVGVAVVFVPSPTGCPVTGATKWLTPNKALLALSLRHRSNDHLWFAFFHEAGHLLLHGKKLTFLEFDGGMNPALEIEADKFAQDQLIPPTLAKELEYLEHRQSAILEFSERAGIAPGIVVGRLQKHYGLAWKTHLNRLKARYQWKTE